MLNGDSLQLTGRGSWFVVQPDEFASLQARVDRHELRITALLPGCGEAGPQADALAFEQQALADTTTLLGLITRERVDAACRALLVVPRDLCWNWWDDVTLEMTFWLPVGSFATSLVRELLTQTDALDNIDE